MPFIVLKLYFKYEHTSNLFPRLFGSKKKVIFYYTRVYVTYVND